VFWAVRGPQDNQQHYQSAQDFYLSVIKTIRLPCPFSSYSELFVRKLLIITYPICICCPC